MFNPNKPSKTVSDVPRDCSTKPEPEPIDAAVIRPEPVLAGCARDYREAAESMMNQLRGTLAEGHQRRYGAESMVSWRSTMQSSGQWKSEQEETYQLWRATQIEFWKEFKSLDAGLFRYQWTTPTGQRTWTEVTRLTKAELEIGLEPKESS